MQLASFLKQQLAELIACFGRNVFIVGEPLQFFDGGSHLDDLCVVEWLLSAN
jgi:hypothetical protein